mmetsp:Transcript_2285/g.4368  ORF Transcript_2285/g.4368 Transcript_2285/m.4368 type:complete len:204 (-) Transcript_2285:1550-2161(-)
MVGFHNTFNKQINPHMQQQGSGHASGDIRRHCRAIHENYCRYGNNPKRRSLSFPVGFGINNTIGIRHIILQTSKYSTDGIGISMCNQLGIHIRLHIRRNGKCRNVDRHVNQRKGSQRNHRGYCFHDCLPRDRPDIDDCKYIQQILIEHRSRRTNWRKEISRLRGGIHINSRDTQTHVKHRRDQTIINRRQQGILISKTFEQYP